MNKLPKFKWISWPEDHGEKGAVVSRLMSKEYRAFKASKKSASSAWDGEEVFEAPDRETGRHWAQNGLPKDVLEGVNTSDLHRKHIRPTPYTKPPPRIKSSLSSLSSNECRYVHRDQTEVIDGEEIPDEPDGAFTRMSMEFARVVLSPHARLAAVLSRHAAMRRSTNIRISEKLCKEAGITSRETRKRAVRTLEKLGVIRPIREAGKCTVALVKLDRHGMLELWSTPD